MTAGHRTGQREERGGAIWECSPELRCTHRHHNNKKRRGRAWGRTPAHTGCCLLVYTASHNLIITSHGGDYSSSAKVALAMMNGLSHRGLPRHSPRRERLRPARMGAGRGGRGSPTAVAVQEKLPGGRIGLRAPPHRGLQPVSGYALYAGAWGERSAALTVAASWIPHSEPRVLRLADLDQERPRRAAASAVAAPHVARFAA